MSTLRATNNKRNPEKNTPEFAENERDMGVARSVTKVEGLQVFMTLAHRFPKSFRYNPTPCK